MLETERNDAENEPGERGSAETSGPVASTLAAGTPASGTDLTADPAAPAAGQAADGRSSARTGRTRRASTRATRPAGTAGRDRTAPGRAGAAG